MSDQQPRVLHHPTPEYSPRTTAILTLYSLLLSIGFLCALCAKTLAIPTEAHITRVIEPHAPIALPQPPAATVAHSPSELPPKIIAPTQNLEHLLEQRESIRQYIFTIFGKDNGPTAYAIALAESGTSYKGELYFKISAVHQSDAETSVGLFQINLRNKEMKIHWSRVPGTSEADKITWLQNPYNNVLVAYWIFSTSGFGRWSTFSDGTYLQFLPGR